MNKWVSLPTNGRNVKLYNLFWKGNLVISIKILNVYVILAFTSSLRNISYKNKNTCM